MTKNIIFEKSQELELYKACQENNFELANFIISELCPSFELGETNVIADAGLAGACRGGHLELANLMIRRGAKYWDWGLKNACQGGHMELVNLMIENGATDWNWGLSEACLRGHMEIAKLMIEKGGKNLNAGLWKPYLDSK